MKRGHAVVALVVIVLALLGVSLLDGADAPEREPGIFTAPGCPAIPDAYAEVEGNVWPAKVARDLVPQFQNICATPAVPSMFSLLSENVTYAAGLEAAAHGVLHRDDDVVATFTVVRVTEDTPALEEGLPTEGAATTQAGELTLLWRRAGSHISVTWLDGRDIIAIAARDESAALDGVAAWLRARRRSIGVVLPPEIPGREGIDRALEAGPPLGGLPQGYTALEWNPVAFMASDFADSSESSGVRAVGAAVVLSPDDALVGTIVSFAGTPEGIGTRGSGFVGESFGTGFRGHGFAAGGMNVLIVGHDNAAGKLSDAWEAEL